jgi:hypothetical protein
VRELEKKKKIILIKEEDLKFIKIDFLEYKNENIYFIIYFFIFKGLKNKKFKKSFFFILFLLELEILNYKY